jgi:hypothetical protein
MEARVVGAETRAEIAEEKVRFISCWRCGKSHSVLVSDYLSAS